MKTTFFTLLWPCYSENIFHCSLPNLSTSSQEPRPNALFQPVPAKLPEELRAASLISLRLTEVAACTPCGGSGAWTKEEGGGFEYGPPRPGPLSPRQLRFSPTRRSKHPEVSLEEPFALLLPQISRSNARTTLFGVSEGETWSLTFAREC